MALLNSVRKFRILGNKWLQEVGFKRGGKLMWHRQLAMQWAAVVALMPLLIFLLHCTQKWLTMLLSWPS